MMSNSLSLILDSLGWALLHSLWQIAAISGVVWIALRIIPERRPAARFAVAYGGLIASLIAFAITLFSYLGVSATTAAPGAATMWAPPPKNLTDWLGQSTWAVSALWSLGFALLSARYVRALRETWRLRHDGVFPVPEFWERNFALWAARVGVGRDTIIHQTPYVSGPVTIGALKPIVLVPAGFFLHLPREQAEAILLHELAHICRQDYLLGLIEEMIKAVFFFHPCIFWLSNQIDAEREYACDEFVLAETGDARSLAQGLGRVAVGTHARGEGYQGASFAMAAAGGPVPVLDRIKRLAGAPVSRTGGSAGFAATISLMLLSASCLIAIGADASAASADPDKRADARIAVGPATTAMTPWPQTGFVTVAAPMPGATAPADPLAAAAPSPAIDAAAKADASHATKGASPEWRAFVRNVANQAFATAQPSGFHLAVAQSTPGFPFATPAQPALPAPPVAVRLASDTDWDGFAERMADLAEAHAEDACETSEEARAEAREALREAAADAREAQREAQHEAAAAIRIAARASAHADRASAIATAHSVRVGAIAGRLAERRVRAAQMRVHQGESMAPEADRLDLEADALELELEAETEAMEAAIEAEIESAIDDAI